MLTKTFVKLEIIRITNNRLKTVPDIVFNAPNLVTLQAESNQFTTLNNLLKTSPFLSVIDLENNTGLVCDRRIYWLYSVLRKSVFCFLPQKWKGMAIKDFYKSGMARN